MPRAFIQRPVLNRDDRPTPAQLLAFELLDRNGFFVSDFALGWHLKQRYPERDYETDAELRDWGRRILKSMVAHEWLVDHGHSSRDEGHRYSRHEPAVELEQAA